MDELRSIPKTDLRRVGLYVGALAGSFNAEPHRALAQYYQEPGLPFETRAMILNAWTTTSAELPQEVTQLLKNLSTESSEDEERRAALLAIGAEVGRTEAGTPARAELERHIEARFDQSVVDALDAAGNSKSTHFLPYIEAYLGDTSDTIRSHALLALRLIPGDRAQALLERGERDRSVRVRNAAITALTMRREN